MRMPASASVVVVVADVEATRDIGMLLSRGHEYCRVIYEVENKARIWLMYGQLLMGPKGDIPSLHLKVMVYSCKCSQYLTVIIVRHTFLV